MANVYKNYIKTLKCKYFLLILHKNKLINIKKFNKSFINLTIFKII